jgi:hypothetical protein
LSKFCQSNSKRGGFGMSGDGDGCRSENTYSEWYMIPNPDPTIFCLGDGRYFEWSTGWTVVDHFKWYFTYNNSYAQNLGWTSSYSTAASMLAPGDVIQLQILGRMVLGLDHIVFLYQTG